MTGPAPYHRDAAVTVYHGDCLDVLPVLDVESVDAVITDPPYALNLTGREQGRPATMLGRLAEGDRAPCTSTLVACPPGCGQARSVRALHALRRDVGGPLSVHYWRMSTHTTPHRPDNRQRSSHPGSAGDEDPVPGRSTMAEIARAAEEADR